MSTMELEAPEQRTPYSTLRACPEQPQPALNASGEAKNRPVVDRKKPDDSEGGLCD